MSSGAFLVRHISDKLALKQEMTFLHFLLLTKVENI